MIRADLKRQAKDAIKGNIWQIVAILILVYFAEAIIAWATFWAGGAAGIIIAGSIQLSLTMIFLGLVKHHGKKPRVEDILLGFKNGNFGRGLIGYLRQVVFTLLWTLLFIVPGIVKSFSYSQMFYLMADDPKLEPGEAQAKSMKIMDGHKMELFMLYLSFLPWMLLCVVTLGIGLIYVVPYVNATIASYYQYVKKARK